MLLLSCMLPSLSCTLTVDVDRSAGSSSQYVSAPKPKDDTERLLGLQVRQLGAAVLGREWGPRVGMAAEGKVVAVRALAFVRAAVKGSDSVTSCQVI